MSRDLQLYLFCYDISRDSRRNRVAEMLEQEGLRVQLSVFELRMTKPAAERLAARLARELDPGDSLRVYPVPARALGDIIVLGSGTAPELTEYYLL